MSEKELAATIGTEVSTAGHAGRDALDAIYAKLRVFDIKNYGAVGNGTTDDSAAIAAAVAALTAAGRGVLFFPSGCYRFANTTPTGSAALYINGISNVTIEFAPDAELLMDNLNGNGGGNGHGILVRGACSNISLINPRVRWKVQPSTRSFGDGIRFMGYPSDSSAPVGFIGSTGNVSDIKVLNSRVSGAPQAGLIFYGCSDINVINHTTYDTLADGLHFNACRRANVNGVSGVNPGDDTLAFVTYYDATNVFTDSINGPFYQPSVGEWSNNNSTATDIVSKGAATNGIRLAGSSHVAICNASIDGSVTAGIVLDAGLTGGGFNWAYQACIGCSVDNVTIRNSGGHGIYVRVFNVTYASDPALWTFGVAFRNITVRNSTQQNVRVAGATALNSGVAGLTFSGIRTFGSGECNFLALRDSSVEDVTANGGVIRVYGSDTTDTSALNTRIRNNVRVGSIASIGGGVFLQDLRDASFGQIRSVNAGGTGVTFTRCMEIEIATMDIIMPNRRAGASVQGFLISPAQFVYIRRCNIVHDASGTTLQPFQIGGGGATNLSSDIMIENGTYRNTYNQAGANIVLQGGPCAPVNYLYDLKFYNGGEPTPAWRRERLGSTGWVEEFYGVGAPGVVSAVGSRFWRTDGGSKTTLYVKESGAGAGTGWVAK